MMYRVEYKDAARAVVVIEVGDWTVDEMSTDERKDCRGSRRAKDALRFTIVASQSVAACGERKMRYDSRRF